MPTNILGQSVVYPLDFASGAVVGVSISSIGDGYTSTPSVVFSGGGGSGAAANAIVASGSIVQVQITNSGLGYGSAPSVSLTGGGGSGFIGSALLGSCYAVKGWLVQLDCTACASTPCGNAYANCDTLLHSAPWGDIDFGCYSTAGFGTACDDPSGEVDNPNLALSGGFNLTYSSVASPTTYNASVMRFYGPMATFCITWGFAGTCSQNGTTSTQAYGPIIAGDFLDVFPPVVANCTTTNQNALGPFCSCSDAYP